MSEVINPPDYYFTGINFNPAFYAQDAGTGLSETTANGLYLRKTVPDTATAIETFNLGIKAQKVDGLLTSSIMYVGNNITSGSLILGNTPIRTKNQGIFETASIRAPATNGTVAICGDATAGGGVDIGSANGTVNLLASSSGGVNVPTSLGASSNAVNVGYLTTALANVATLNQVQIFTGTNTFNNNSVTFGQPLTPAYTYPIASGKIGQIVVGSLTPANNEAFTTSTDKTYTTLSLTTGVWLITGSTLANIPATCSITQAQAFIKDGSSVYSLSQITNQIGGTSIYLNMLVSNSIYVSSNRTYSIIMNIAFTGTAPTVNNFEFRCQAVRLA